MRIWKRLLGTALCLCLCAELLPVTARAAATLPVTFSTLGLPLTLNDDFTVKSPKKTLASFRGERVILSL